MKKVLDFLTSRRFWKVVIIATLGVLVQEGVVDGGVAQTVTQAVQIILGTSVGIETVDKLGKNIGQK